MTTNNIVKKITNLYEERIALIRGVSLGDNVGGKIRSLSGSLGEDISALAWGEVGRHYSKLHNFEFETLKGDSRKVLCINGNKNSIEMQVDRHQYIDDELFHIEECKSYLDRCYMIRASDDFRMIKKHTNNNITSSIMAIENSVKKESYDFIMDEGYIDDVFFLADGKRSSTKPIWKEGHYKPLNKTKVAGYIKTIVSIFEKRA
tara:strand:+ start:193 stop:804 length:612 start_codon:yes stop_codon:yes gene_type:complete